MSAVERRYRDDAQEELPVVIATSVIRSAYQGQSHGGVYLVDLEREVATKVIDWDTGDIDWSGRGGDRGLRGVAFWRDEIYLAAADEVFVYDHNFKALRSLRNAYLGHCHEIDIADDKLFLSSCGFDSVLEYDLVQRRFTAGYCLRYGASARAAAKLTSRRVRPRPSFAAFDPLRRGGPHRADTCHINSVTSSNGRIYFSGRQIKHLYCIAGGRLSRYASVPFGTHNARPWAGGALYNDTAADRVVYADRRGRSLAQFVVKMYNEPALRNQQLAKGHARQAFGRGLAIYKGSHLIAGSSPATISVYDLQRRSTVRSINLSMDVRNAIHGLEIWPFSKALPKPAPQRSV